MIVNDDADDHVYGGNDDNNNCHINNKDDDDNNDNSEDDDDDDVHYDYRLGSSTFIIGHCHLTISSLQHHLILYHLH